MSTYGERLVELSELPTGTASQHFLAITGKGDIVYIDSYSEDAALSIVSDEAEASISSDDSSLAIGSDESTITINSQDSTISITDDETESCL